MTQYLLISEHIAGQVRSRVLRPGSELPAVRVLAAQAKVTPSTAARAFRHLAEAGVITVEPRRRARIAPGAYPAALRLLHGERVFRLAGSDDPALSLLLGHLERGVELTGTRGSFPALRDLAAGKADGAAIHLRHHDGEYNAPYARALLHGRDPHLIRLWSREQGLITAPRNPHRITGLGDLAGRRVAKREQGAGTRVLLEQLLITAGLSPDRISGPEFASHLEIALAVASGVADTGLALRTAADQLRLGFLPLAWERYDIVLPAAALGAAQPLLHALAGRTIRSALSALPGYDLTDTGEVIRLDTTPAPRRRPRSTSAN